MTESRSDGVPHLPLPGLPEPPELDTPGQPLELFQPPPTGPHRCEDTPAFVLRALEGIPDPAVIDAVRSRLAPCPPCVQALDVEIRFKLAMSQRATDKAPASLQLRISETLRRVDLGDIDVSDL